MIEDTTHCEVELMCFSLWNAHAGRAIAARAWVASAFFLADAFITCAVIEFTASGEGGTTWVIMTAEEEFSIMSLSQSDMRMKHHSSA